MKISNTFLDYVKDYSGLKILDFVASQVSYFDRIDDIHIKYLFLYVFSQKMSLYNVQIMIRF